MAILAPLMTAISEEEIIKDMVTATDMVRETSLLIRTRCLKEALATPLSTTSNLSIRKILITITFLLALEGIH